MEYLYPGGLAKAITFSYDDGQVYDRTWMNNGHADPAQDACQTLYNKPVPGLAKAITFSYGIPARYWPMALFSCSPLARPAHYHRPGWQILNTARYLPDADPAT